MEPDLLHELGTVAATDAGILSRVKGMHILTWQMNVVGMESGSWSPKGLFDGLVEGSRRKISSARSIV